MKENSENILANAKIKPLIFTLAIPSIVAQVINILYNIVDKMYVGRLENTNGMALAALGLCTPLLLLIASFSMFVCGGAAPIAAIFLGQGKRRESEEVLGLSTFLLLCIGSILSIFAFIFQVPLLRAFGATDAMFKYAQDYFSIYVMGTIFVQISIGLNTFISAQGRAKTAMISVSIGAVINIILDPIFIFTLKMGVAGAALATIISQALSAVFVLSFLFSNNSQIQLKIENIRLNLRYIRQILALGISPFIMQATESAIILVLNRQLLKYGSELYIAALTIMQSLMQLLIIPISGFTNGVQPIMSYNLGAKKYRRVIDTVRYSLIICFSASLVYNLLIVLFPRAFASIFTSEEVLLNIVEKYIVVFMLGMWIFSIQMLTQSFLVGTNQPKASLFIALLRKVIILIPLAFLLPIWLGVDGVFYSEAIADITSASISGIILFFAIKKLKRENSCT